MENLDSDFNVLKIDRNLGATLFGQLKIGQLNLASYFMQMRLDLEGLKL